MPTKFAPTTKRGAALAREILTTIEAEEAKRQRYDIDYQMINDKTNVWNQSTWVAVEVASFPPGVEVEAVPQSAVSIKDKWAFEDMGIIAFSNGLSCGTAMCFAGHVTHALGDRMLMTVPPRAVESLTKRQNFKRFAKKIRSSFRRNVFTHFNSAADYVLNSETQRVEHIRHRAQEALDLTNGEASKFFSAGNGLETLRRYVERMEDGRNIVTHRRDARTKGRVS